MREVDRASHDPAGSFPSTQEADGPINRPEDLLLAELDGSVVGYLRLVQAYPMPEAAHVLSCRGLAVSPTAQRRGVATALLEAAADEARRRGATKIRLGVFSTNTGAIALYTRHGYVQEGRFAAEFVIDGQPVDDLQLSLFL